MSEITTGSVVGTKPTTEEILALARKQGGPKAAKASGEASQPKDGSMGRSLANQAREANQRALVLKTRMEGVNVNNFSYASSIKRFNDLQGTAGVTNIALAGLDLSFISVNPFNKVRQGGQEHSICLDSAEAIKTKLHNPDFQGQDSMSILKAGLEKVQDKIPNDAVSKEIDGILEGINLVRAQVFSAEHMDNNVVWDISHSEPTSRDSSKFSGIARTTAHDFHQNTMRLSANAYACSDMDPEKATQLKSTMQESLKKSWTLAHRLEVIAKTQKNMQGATEAIKDLKKVVKDILKYSDTLLIREQGALQGSVNN